MLIFNTWMYKEQQDAMPMMDPLAMIPMHHHLAKYLMVPRENLMPSGFDSLGNMISLFNVLFDILQQLVELIGHLSDLSQ